MKTKREESRILKTSLFDIANHNFLTRVKSEDYLGRMNTQEWQIFHALRMIFRVGEERNPMYGIQYIAEDIKRSVELYRSKKDGRNCDSF